MSSARCDYPKVGRLASGRGQLELIERYGADIPRYANLSHTWGKDEVLYSDIRDAAAGERKAFSKVTNPLEQAQQDGYAYLWVATCCIDKSSSSELSEAINSMWTWYRNAGKCYAHLSDIPDPSLEDLDIRDAHLSQFADYLAGQGAFGVTESAIRNSK